VALDGGERSTSHPECFTPGEKKNLGIHFLRTNANIREKFYSQTFMGTKCGWRYTGICIYVMSSQTTKTE